MVLCDLAPALQCLLCKTFGGPDIRQLGLGFYIFWLC